MVLEIREWEMRGFDALLWFVGRANKTDTRERAVTGFGLARF